MNCNVLAQKRQMDNKPILLHHSSVKRLTGVLLVCFVVCPHMTNAQPPDTSSLNGTTLSEFINVGPGQTVNKDISDFTNFYSHSQTVGVWVDGGLFTDDTGKADQKQIQIFSPAVFQVGGKRLYDTDPPQNTAEDSLGGRIRFNSLITSSYPDLDPSVHPDVSIILLGSSGSDSTFSAGWVSLSPSLNNEVSLYIDGFNSSCKTSFEVDKYLRLSGDADRLNGGKLSFILKNSGSLSVGGNLDMAFTSPGDRFVVRNDSPLGGEKKTQKISVGGHFYLYNSATRPEDLSTESDEAIIKNTDMRIGDQFALAGGLNFTVGDTTFLQVINDPGVTAAITAPEILVYSNQSGNTTALLLGHGAKVNAENYVFVLSQNSSKAQLLLGDSLSKDDDYGVVTPYIWMQGDQGGSSEVIFNNAHRGNSAETASFVIKGGGTVVAQSGRTILSKESTYSGKTNIAKDATLILKTISSAGRSEILNNGELVFSEAQGALHNEISGPGAVLFEDNARISILNDAKWTGPTELRKATLMIGTVDKPIHVSSPSVSVSSEGILYGFGSINGSLNNAGFFMVGDNKNASPSDFNIGSNIVNSGEIHLGNGKSAGSSLIVHGNYTGNNGLLAFNTILNGDNDSPTDKLVVKGDTAGNTKVRVKALGGSGKQTNTGIELIHVDGASEGSFTQEGRIVAGAYEYNLERGAGDNNKNWYLKSHLIKDKGQHGRTGPSSDQDEIPLYRPEAGAYVGNSAVVQTLFSSRLHDRIGDLWYADPYAENNQLTGMWVKQRGNYNTWRESSGQTRNRTQMYATQIGADVASWTSNGENRFLVGWVAGYGHGRTKSRSIHTGYHAIGTVDGLNVGITGTWYQDGTHHEGMYVDTWLTYGWFDNKVKGQGIETEKYHSRGFTGSLETGYTWKLGEHVTEKGCDIGWFLQPQAQVIWSGVKTDTFHEHNGTAVKSKGRNNIQTRLGARLMLDTNLRSYANGIGGTQLFIEGNWVHNTKSHGVEMNGTVLNQEGARHLGEIKVGLNGKPTDNLHIWTNVTARAGTHHYRDLTGMIGLKYSF